jgi:hypothetical protein
MSSVGIHHPQHALLNISNPPGQCSVTQKAKYSDFPQSSVPLHRDCVASARNTHPLKAKIFPLLLALDGVEC